MLPNEVAMRFLDVFFYEGGKFLFKVGLSLFGIHQNSLLQVVDGPKMMLLCRSLPETIKDAAVLMKWASHMEFLSERKVREIRSNAAKTVQTKKEAKEREAREREKS